MKRSILFVLLVFLLNPLFCQSGELAKIEKEEKVSNIYYFNGFNFKKYDPNSPADLTDIVNDEIECINNDSSSKQKYAIVGHSQGGLRVLAYSKMLEEKASKDSNYKTSADNLSAVVTVSGIDRGLKALNGGFEAVNKKIDDNVSIIYDGVDASLHANAAIGFYTDALKLLSSGLNYFDVVPVDFRSKKSVKMFVLGLLPENYSCYIRKAVEGASEDSMPEIRDMIPESTFIKENVDNTQMDIVKVIDPSKTTTSLKITYKTVKVLGIKIKIPYITTIQTTGYSYKIRYISESRASNKVPYMYVVGLNNNTLKLTEQASDGKCSESVVRTFAYAMGGVMEVGIILNTVQNTFLFGNLYGGKGRVADCKRAKKWFLNINDEINTILGSSEHDGLVAKESQFYPKAWHTNIIDPYGIGYVPEDNENHDSIDPTKNERVRKDIKSSIKFTLEEVKK